MRKAFSVFALAVLLTLAGTVLAFASCSSCNSCNSAFAGWDPWCGCGYHNSGCRPSQCYDTSIACNTCNTCAPIVCAPVTHLHDLCGAHVQHLRAR